MPDDVDLVARLNAGLEALIPAAHRMGVRFTELHPGHAAATVPVEGNGNHWPLTLALPGRVVPAGRASGAA